MHKTQKQADAVLKILLAVILLAVVILLCASRGSFVAQTCVDMPLPEETVSEFFDALIDGRYDDCDKMLSNYSTLGLTSSTDTAIGEQLFALLRSSYSYQLLSGSDIPVVVSAADLTAAEPVSASNLPTLIAYSHISEDSLRSAIASTGASGKDAAQAVAFTHLDIKSISEDLHQAVTDIAYNYAYHSIDVNNEETASAIVNEALTLISADIEKYYRTDIYVIRMEYVNGDWKIILTEDLYKAIIGNIT